MNNGRARHLPADRHGLATMQEALSNFLRESGMTRRVGHGHVFDAFHRALGPALARHARAVKFARGELIVEIDSAPHHQELSGFTGALYLTKANEILGRKEIVKVTYRLKR
jgi:hypothetical protein